MAQLLRRDKVHQIKKSIFISILLKLFEKLNRRSSHAKFHCSNRRSLVGSVITAAAFILSPIIASADPYG